MVARPRIVRGDVWLAALDPTIGGKIQKTQPYVIISPPETSARCDMETMALPRKMLPGMASSDIDACPLVGKRGKNVKYYLTRFKDLHLCLRELEPFIRNGQHLETGKPFKQFGRLRSRELLANWLLCVAVNSVSSANRLTFFSDPFGGDGIIQDAVTGETWLTEHVLVPRSRAATGPAVPLASRILAAIERKQRKGGSSYASGKTLVVFLNAGDAEPWFPNKVARQLPAQDFVAVWVVGLHAVEAGEYIYNVTRLDVSQGNAPVWRVRLRKDFNDWKVDPVQ